MGRTVDQRHAGPDPDLAGLRWTNGARPQAASAANRKESRGAHAHEDFPERDDANGVKNTLAWVVGDADVKIDYRPVHMVTLDDEIEVIPPKKRTY